jgi:hypothetical protein
MTAAPLPVPAPLRRLLVPAWTLVVALAAALALGIAMFALGRAAHPPLAAGETSDPSLAALVRIDSALHSDLALAKQLLDQAALPAGPAGEAAVALRRKQIAALEAALAANAELRSPAAVARRLAASLHRLDQSGLAWVPAPAPAPNPAAAPAAAPALEPSVLDGEPFTPLARIAHPGDPQRVYALHPGKGLLRSSDGGATWRTGIGALAALSGTALAFSNDPEPLLLVIGGEIWAFADHDPAFFPH